MSNWYSLCTKKKNHILLGINGNIWVFLEYDLFCEFILKLLVLLYGKKNSLVHCLPYSWLSFLGSDSKSFTTISKTEVIIEEHPFLYPNNLPPFCWGKIEAPRIALEV